MERAMKNEDMQPAKGGVDADMAAQLALLQKFRIVIRAAQRHSQWVEKQCGVSGAQLWVIQELSEHPGLRVGELARRMAIHQTTVSNLLYGLEKRGLISKERDRSDQRVVKLVLSDSGKALLESAPKPARGLLPEAMRKLDPEAMVLLDQGLQALIDGIGLLDEDFSSQPMPFMM
jgi:DNA-binding MarR family transcriptional regulator